MTESSLRSDSAGDSSPRDPEIWRQEIHARLERYRTRRERRAEGPNLNLQFPVEEAVALAPVSDEIEEKDDGESEKLQPEAAEMTFTPVEESPDTLAEPASFPEPEPLDISPVEPEIPAQLVEEQESAWEPEQAALPALEPLSESEPLPKPKPKVRRKVIAFPKQVTRQVSQQVSQALEVVQRLAEPIVPEQPRILDVPEEHQYPNTPFLDGLHFGAEPAAQAARAAARDHIELPFRVVSIGRRVQACLVDCAIVLLASATFAGVCYGMLHKPILNKPLLLTAAAIPPLLWAIYEYLFITHGGLTAGMQLTGLRIRTFKGDAPRRRERRKRVLAVYFSTASLGMGLLWALVDVDTLCWHDRMSHTYLTGREQNS